MDSITKCLILAGGLGTRLKSISGDTPKPMMPIGNKAFLEILIERLHKFNLFDINISISYNSDYFLNYFKNSKYNFITEKEPLGTGGAIKYALNKLDNFDQVIILNGDTLFDINYQEMLLKHKINDADVTIAAKIIQNPSRYGTLEIANNRISKFVEKKELPSGVINCGIYIINKNVLNHLPETDKFSFETDFLEKATSNLKIIPYISDNYFIDIGIPEDYQKAIDYLS